MSREVSVREVQSAISDLRAWQHDECPEWGRAVVQACCDLIERVLYDRDKLPPTET